MVNLARVKLHEVCKSKKIEGKIPLGSPSHNWENNVKEDIKETGCKDLEYIHVDQ